MNTDQTQNFALILLVFAAILARLYMTWRRR